MRIEYFTTEIIISEYLLNVLQLAFSVGEKLNLERSQPYCQMLMEEMVFKSEDFSQV